MTKRQNPWRDDTPMQLKNHISVKEVANGIDGNIYKDEILDHTKQLLMAGAKKFYSQTEELERNALNNNNNNNEKENMNQCDRHQQKSIVEFFTKEAKPNTGKSSKTVVPPGKCFHSTPETKCEFCLNSICCKCLRTCTSCDKTYCTRCSFIRYEGSGENAMCFSCN